jgi:hypothetical protein
MSVRIERGSTWRAGKPTKLFEGQYYGRQFTGDQGNSARTYDVSPDGRRFLMIKAANETGPLGVREAAPNFVVVLNWLEELKTRVPTR